jgi:hypothetical protein
LSCRETALGKCYWARGTYATGADLSEITLALGKKVEVEPPPPFSGLEKHFGPSGEGISALYKLCPARVQVLSNLTVDGACIAAARDIKTEPLPERLYRDRPDLRARWDAFRKAHPEKLVPDPRPWP